MDNIREARIEDLPYVKRLTDENISEDFYTIEYLEEVLKDPHQHMYVYLPDQNIPVAYIYIFYTSFGRARSILNLPQDIVYLDELSEQDIVCVYKTTCTDKVYRQKGIHSAFVKYLDETLDKKRAKITLLEAIKKPDDRVPAHQVIYADGFRPIQEIQSPWIHKKSYCPYCEKLYCECNAVLYVKE